jgi:hypothetical protein
MTNLPTVAFKKLGEGINLSELRNSSRRLHAKLLAWESVNGTGCLVGSANFTLAAFDGRNVEACLLLSDTKEIVSGLFDGQLAKRPLAFGDFDPGTEQEPEAESVDAASLRLDSALLTDAGEFRVSYRHRLATKPSSLRLAIRTPGEQRPRAFFNVPNKESGTTTVNPPDSALKDAHGTILASLVAEVGDVRVESPPIWVIQEGRLTYEPSGEGSSSAKSKIEESGEGLTEFLEELGKRDGVAAVIEYLRHLNIRFHDGGGGLHGGRSFPPRIRDPFHADVAPHWLLNAEADTNNLAEAVYDFVDRHEKQRLRRHAKRGNINGMENFLDILTALVRLLYVYYKRGVVKEGRLIECLRTFIELGTIGRRALGEDAANESFGGYLCSVHSSLEGDVKLLREVCGETNYIGHMRAVLLIAQKVRFEQKPDLLSRLPQPTRPRNALTCYAGAVKKAITRCGLKEPQAVEVRKALESYQMLTEDEIVQLVGELPAPSQNRDSLVSK